jgi:hypothetical protein
MADYNNIPSATYRTRRGQTDPPHNRLGIDNDAGNRERRPPRASNLPNRHPPHNPNNIPNEQQRQGVYIQRHGVPTAPWLGRGGIFNRNVNIQEKTRRVLGGNYTFGDLMNILVPCTWDFKFLPTWGVSKLSVRAPGGGSIMNNISQDFIQGRDQSVTGLFNASSNETRKMAMLVTALAFTLMPERAQRRRNYDNKQMQIDHPDQQSTYTKNINGTNDLLKPAANRNYHPFYLFCDNNAGDISGVNVLNAVGNYNFGASAESMAWNVLGNKATGQRREYVANDFQINCSLTFVIPNGQAYYAGDSEVQYKVKYLNQGLHDNINLNQHNNLVFHRLPENIGLFYLAVMKLRLMIAEDESGMATPNGQNPLSVANLVGIDIEFIDKRGVQVGACLTERKKALITVPGFGKAYPIRGSNNNCLLQSLWVGKKFYEEKFGIQIKTDEVSSNNRQHNKLFDFIRMKVLNVTLNSPMSYANKELIQKLAKFFSVSITIVNEQGQVLQSVEIEETAIVINVLFIPQQEIGHYIFIQPTVHKEEIICPSCFLTYRQKHTCHVRTRGTVNGEEVGEYQPLMCKHPDQQYRDKSYTTVPDKTPTIYFDIETYTDGGKLIPYAVGAYFHGELGDYYKDFWITDHDNVLEAFLEYIKDEITEFPTNGKHHLPVFLKAWNSSRFDTHLVMNELLQGSLGPFLEVYDYCEQNRIIYSFSFAFEKKKKFIVLDPCLHMHCSLSSACKTYNIPESECKGIFPHFLMEGKASHIRRLLNSSIDLDTINDEKYYPSTMKPNWTRDMIAKYSTLGELCKDYLKSDVKALTAVCEVFFPKMSSLLNMETKALLTLGSAAWGDITGKKSFQRLYGPLNKHMYWLSRQATYGGRTYAIRTSFPSKNDEVIDRLTALFGNAWPGLQHEQVFDLSDKKMSMIQEWIDSNSILIQKDATSLYPAAMVKYKYPVGPWRYVTDELIKEFNDNLKICKGQKDSTPFKYLSILCVKYVPNKKLMHAILPSKREKRLNWDLRPGEGCYTSVDLEEACRYGYDIEVISGIFWTDCEDIFSESITPKFQWKKEAKEKGDVVQTKIAKLLINMTFGKTLQHDVQSRSFICRTPMEFKNLLLDTNYNITNIQIQGDGSRLFVKAEKKEIDLNRPYHLGAFILSYSRKIMNNVFSTLKNTDCYYTDTDCVYVPPNSAQLDEGKEIGQMKDESLDDGKVVLAIFSGKKQYCQVLVKPEEKKAYIKLAWKGVPQEYLRMMHYFSSEGTLIQLKKRLKRTGLENNCAIINEDISRTITNKYYARIPVDPETLIYDISSTFTIPHGHNSDPYKFGHTEYAILRENGLEALKIYQEREKKKKEKEIEKWNWPEWKVDDRDFIITDEIEELIEEEILNVDIDNDNGENIEFLD